MENKIINLRYKTILKLIKNGIDSDEKIRNIKIDDIFNIKGITTDDIKNINLDLAANYATLTYVDEQISTHDHNVISDDEIIQEINKY